MNNEQIISQYQIAKKIYKDKTGNEYDRTLDEFAEYLQFKPKHIEKHISGDAIQDAINLWLETEFINANKPAIFFTINFIRRTGRYEKKSIDRKVSESILNGWLNRVDRKSYNRQQIDAGCRLERIVFRHMGDYKNNLHYHGVIRPNGNLLNTLKDCQNALKDMKRVCLKKYDQDWINLNTSKIEIAENLRDCSYYSAREVRKIGDADSWMNNQTFIRKLDS